MKYLLTILILFCYIVSFGQNDEKITIPRGVVYKYCSKNLVEKAKKLISADITDSTQYKLSDNILIVGPVLWNRFKKIEVLENIKNGNTNFHVDKKILTGKMTQDIEDTKIVWNELRKEINGQDFIIRKLNEKELVYYWSVISFDIDEPLLIVETKEHKYILNILKDKMKLMWLDEAPE
ncbi:MAG: hypothetical protein Q8M15_12695 [Bacteroidota bacterium]|nr:hypothetical protein [Bacteroidota bacterium]